MSNALPKAATDREMQAAFAKFEQEQEQIMLQLEKDRAAGVPALKRLVDLCETRDSGQIARIARLLAGLYNGYAYPFDLTDLRGLDPAILDDCLAVLRMDSCPQQEVHQYFENGDRRFQSIFKSFGIRPIQRKQD